MEMFLYFFRLCYATFGQLLNESIDGTITYFAKFSSQEIDLILKVAQKSKQPKSAPYPRLKIAEELQSVKVLSSTAPEKVF